MSSARARANHKLYLAKIQLSAWQQMLAAQDITASTLNQAFLPALQAHLLGAYGWFLVAVCGIEQLPDKAPRCCDELPVIASGKAVPGEIREFRQLETGGWLAELLAESEGLIEPGHAPGNLAVAAPVSPPVERAANWIDELETLFGRMSNSLDEC